MILKLKKRYVTLHYTCVFTYTQGMPSLYETTSFTKTILKWVGIVVGIIVGIVLLYRGGKLLATVLFPKKPAPPTVAYGKLPALIFPQSVSTTPFTYNLDTITGTLGTFPDRANVYKTFTPVPNLLNLQNARDALSQTTFRGAETKITDTQYSWGDTLRGDKTISMNIISGDFTISSNYFTYPDLSPESLINTQTAIGTVTDFLSDLNLYPSDFDDTKTTTQLLTVQGTSVFAAASVSTADLVRVDLFQKDLNKIPVVYEHPPYSSIHFLVGGPQTSEILEGAFAHQSIITNEAATYPLRTVSEAYDLLKEHKAYVASYYGSSNQVSIKNIYLAYFLTEAKQKYIMPVYVFEGKDGFNAYVPAITNAWSN